MWSYELKEFPCLGGMYLSPTNENAVYEITCNICTLGGCHVFIFAYVSIEIGLTSHKVAEPVAQLAMRHNMYEEDKTRARRETLTCMYPSSTLRLSPNCS